MGRRVRARSSSSHCRRVSPRCTRRSNRTITPSVFAGSQFPPYPQPGLSISDLPMTRSSGTGWHFAEDAGTQHFRWSRRTSTVRWQMEAPAELRFILPLRAAHANGATIRASLNGVELSSCALPAGAWIECRLEAPSSATRAGVNDLQLSSDTVAPDRPGDPRELAFAMQHGRVRVGK